MKNLQILLFFMLVTTLITPVWAKESREQKQDRLDAACEVKRQELLAPLRSKYIAECISNKELPSRQECERFYADYGVRMGGRAPLYYDLPECVKAFEFQQSARSSGS